MSKKITLFRSRYSKQVLLQKWPKTDFVKSQRSILSFGKIWQGCLPYVCGIAETHNVRTPSARDVLIRPTQARLSENLRRPKAIGAATPIGSVLTKATPPARKG